jgi:NADH:ubiquinone oxidoreductase subunit E
MSEKAKEILSGFDKERGNLVPILWRVQQAESSLSPEAIAAVSRYLDLSQNYVYSVASSYSIFRFTCSE